MAKVWTAATYLLAEEADSPLTVDGTLGDGGKRMADGDGPKQARWEDPQIPATPSSSGPQVASWYRRRLSALQTTPHIAAGDRDKVPAAWVPPDPVSGPPSLKHARFDGASRPTENTPACERGLEDLARGGGAVGPELSLLVSPRHAAGAPPKASRGRLPNGVAEADRCPLIGPRRMQLPGSGGSPFYAQGSARRCGAGRHFWWSRGVDGG